MGMAESADCGNRYFYRSGKKYLHGFRLKRLYMKTKMNIIRYYRKLTISETPPDLSSLCLK